jgi:hypothetical protein
MEGGLKLLLQLNVDDFTTLSTSAYFDGQKKKGEIPMAWLIAPCITLLSFIEHILSALAHYCSFPH